MARKQTSLQHTSIPARFRRQLRSMFRVASVRKCERADETVQRNAWLCDPADQAVVHACVRSGLPSDASFGPSDLQDRRFLKTDRVVFPMLQMANVCYVLDAVCLCSMFLHPKLSALGDFALIGYACFSQVPESQNALLACNTSIEIS